jgi:hypothetical protein
LFGCAPPWFWTSRTTGGNISRLRSPDSLESKSLNLLALRFSDPEISGHPDVKIPDILALGFPDFLELKNSKHLGAKIPGPSKL